jgi:glutaconate CoA-transferase subunit A
VRDAIEHGWPRPVELEERSHAGMANRYVAGASDLPFAVLRGYRGTDLVGHARVKPVTCPFTGEQLMAVPALRPDVAIVHAQEADRHGNVQLLRTASRRRRYSPGALARDRRADRRRARAPAGWRRDSRLVIDAVAVAPGGAYPSYAHGITERDNDFLRAAPIPTGWS